MALIHQATLVPSKLDAIAAWLPTQVWGTACRVSTSPHLSVRRVIDAAPTELPHLLGTWQGQDEPIVLVELRN